VELWFLGQGYVSTISEEEKPKWKILDF